jgi:hypothetical protein
VAATRIYLEEGQRWVFAAMREAERAYAPKVGCRVPPRTAWPEQRSMLAAALRAGPTGTVWPVRYTIRRCAWHVLDHAWEMEDRSE